MVSVQESDIRVGIFLGKNWRRRFRAGKKESESEISEELELSNESKITAVAAYRMYQSGEINRVVFSTGKTAKKSEKSEAQAMYDYLESVGKHIPLEHVLIEEISFDTPSNAAECKKIIDEKGWKDVTLVTVGYHLPRSKKIFHNFGVEVKKYICSEDVLEQYSMDDELTTERKLFEEFNKEYLMSMVEWVRERILYTLLFVDKKGEIPQIFTRIIRNRQ